MLDLPFNYGRSFFVLSFSAADKYKRDMAQYKQDHPELEVKGKKRKDRDEAGEAKSKKRPKKDPAAPKRPKNAYSEFGPPHSDCQCMFNCFN